MYLANMIQLVNARDLEVMKTYVADTPLNSASITPKKDFVILGGGQAAMDVTTTSTRQGKFEARFYHKIFEEEIGRVRGHFGPLSEFHTYHISLRIYTDICFQIPLPWILLEKAMPVEERMVMSEFTSLTRRTLISHMRLRDKQERKDRCRKEVLYCICGRCGISGKGW